MDSPFHMHWTNGRRIIKSKNKHNVVSKADTKYKLEEWEPKIFINKYLNNLKIYKEGMKA